MTDRQVEENYRRLGMPEGAHKTAPVKTFCFRDKVMVTSGFYKGTFAEVRGYYDEYYRVWIPSSGDVNPMLKATELRKATWWERLWN